MFAFSAVTLACAMVVSVQLPIDTPGSDDRAMSKKREWEAAVATLNPRLNAREFGEEADKLRVVAHLPQGALMSTGGALGCGSWSGCSVMLDADWLVVRESAQPDAGVNPGELSLPVRDGAGMVVRVVGLPDIAPCVDPSLWEAVRVIHRSPNFFDFDPVNLIRAVNTLQSMGEERAFAALEAYNKLCDDNGCQAWLRLDPDRILWIARLLYVSKNIDAPISGPAIGGMDVMPVRGSRLEASFPLVVQDGVPFFVVGGITVAGMPEAPMWFVERCRKNGRFRDAQLVPTLDPIAAADAFLNSERIKDLQPGQWGGGGPDWFDWLQERVRNQALAAAVMKTGPRRPEVAAWKPITEEEWNAVRLDAVNARMVWNRELLDFERTVN